MRVLVAMPMVQDRKYRPAIDAAFALEWPERLDYLMLVGGDDLDTPFKNITHKYKYARQVMLDSGYDALLTLESDIIAPPDALLKLAAVEADVAYGLYVWRGIWPFWSAYSQLTKRIGRTVAMDKEKALDAWGKVIEVAGIGHGCTLIHRRVLEVLDFRLADDMAYCCDWTFGLDCQAHGFVQKCDTSVVCGHIKLDPEICIAWPDISKHHFYRWAEIGPPPEGILVDGLTYAKQTQGRAINGPITY